MYAVGATVKVDGNVGDLTSLGSNVTIGGKVENSIWANWGGTTIVGSDVGDGIGLGVPIDKETNIMI